MNAPEFTQDHLLFTVITPLGDNILLFKSLQGEESLSEPFHFHVEMLSERDNLNFDKLVGNPLTVQIQFAPQQIRYLNGWVTRFTQAGSDARFTIYHAEIRPWFWFLTLTKNSQIFQNLSVPEIIKKVFHYFGFTDYREALIYGYEKRVYCVQYEETAFNFVSRLMEDEGIFYFFEHTQDQHILVLADDLSVHSPCPGFSTARFRFPNTQESIRSEDVITECHGVKQVTTNQYGVEDFNFEIPRFDLESNTRSPKAHPMRVYEYAAGFGKLDPGGKKAQRRLEACLADEKLIEGQGHCFSFTSGYQFTLTQHPRLDLNAKYVLRWVSHSLSLTHYSNSFRAAPAEVPFRSPLATPKPRIVSTQTAIVTGPAGEEIWTDRYGRIKVQFHWDQEGKYDENSSCWIRVNQGWAGKGWGHMAIPRIGQEVIVSFLEGDPDRPLVTGAVYNGEQFVPYPLPAEQTKSTIKSHSSKENGGFNEIRFEDRVGNEEIYTHAQKDQNEVVENNMSTLVKANQTIMVQKNKAETVGMNKAETIGIAKALTTGAAYQVTVGAVMNTTVALSQSEEVGKVKKVIVGDKFELVCGQGKITVEKNGKVTIEGTEFLFTASGDVKINGKVIDLN